jgi:hypothetical protein
MGHKRRPVSPATQIRRRKVMKGLLEGKPMVDATTEAGYALSTARKTPQDIMPGVQEEFVEEFDRQLPRDEMVAGIKPGMSAERTTHIYNVRTGQVEHYSEPGWHARAKFYDLACKVGGFIIRKEEMKVTHSVDWAAIIAARGRAGLLPAGTLPSGTVDVQAEPVSDTPLEKPAETLDGLGLMARMSGNLVTLLVHLKVKPFCTQSCIWQALNLHAPCLNSYQFPPGCSQ